MERNAENARNRGKVIFRGMSANIPGNVAKYSGNVAKHSREYRQTFRGMSSNIPGNVLKHFGECRQTFWRMSPSISVNIAKHSGEYHQRSPGITTTGLLSNSTVGRLSMGLSFIKLFVVCTRFYKG